ncbi:hypothetical protein GCM10007385_39400 [Tateyamaria omphalii]|nr:hypothetical protein GCM10007385_39400 [Tateyamaria omphalii]
MTTPFRRDYAANTPLAHENTLGRTATLLEAAWLAASGRQKRRFEEKLKPMCPKTQNYLSSHRVCGTSQIFDSIGRENLKKSTIHVVQF